MRNILILSWQQEIWQTLTKNQPFRCHALLLKGRKGIGKLEFAQNLAKSLLCSHPTSHHEACGQCSSCSWFEQDGHPDYLQLLPEALTGTSNETTDDHDGESTASNTKGKKKSSQQISVEQIRNLTDFVYLTGHQNGYRIVLIYPAEAMNSAASNALLKKLEEPPPQVIFILVTHQPQHLLPTLRSRCQQIAMPVPDIKTSITWLQQQGIQNPDACLAAVGFSPLSALSFHDSDDMAYHDQLIQQISEPARFNPLTLADTLQQADLSPVVGWLQKWCYDLISYRTTGEIRYYRYQHASIEKLANQINLEACIAYSRSLIKSQGLARHPLNPRLFLEEILVSYARIINRS